MKSSASRYVTALGDEGEFEPGSNGLVLKNVLGITSKREMDRVENSEVRGCAKYFADVVTADTHFTLDLISDIHRRIFGKIYAWAGQVRTVNVSKGGFTWPPPQFLSNALIEFEDDVLKRLTPLHEDSTESIARAVAEVHAEFLMIHPFRDGNGRVARIIAMLMASQASITPPFYAFAGKGSRKRKADYLSAVIQGYYKNYTPLTRFFVEALGRSVEGSVLDITKGPGRLRPRAPSNTLDS